VPLADRSAQISGDQNATKRVRGAVPRRESGARKGPLTWCFSGADDRIRTGDPNLGKVIQPLFVTSAFARKCWSAAISRIRQRP
jgi:hypothetical protein